MQLKLKIYTSNKDLQKARACNYRGDKGWNIVVFLHKIHGNTGYKKIAEKINNLSLMEYLCTLIRRDTEKLLPLCENEIFSYRGACACEFLLWKGMKLKIK